MPTEQLILVATAFLTSALSGVIGLGGGAILLIALGQFFPPAVLIPIHACVQMASNVSRAAMSRKHIHWLTVAQVLVGSAIGAALAFPFVRALPERQFRLIIAASVTLFTWLPPLKLPFRSRGKFVGVGCLAGFAGPFIGATGVLIQPFFLRSFERKETVIATGAACQTLNHLSKLAVFLGLGTTFLSHPTFIIAMVAASIAGSWVARRYLAKLPERAFRYASKAVVTALAARLAFTALS